MISQYIADNSTEPLFICGDSLDILRLFPDNCIDMAMTSPPYWGKREYEIEESIGLEKSYAE